MASTRSIRVNFASAFALEDHDEDAIQRHIGVVACEMGWDLSALPYRTARMAKRRVKKRTSRDGFLHRLRIDLAWPDLT